MIFGMTLLTFVHVLLSLIGILAGFIVMLGLLTSKALKSWTAVFIWTTVATSATGFLFTFHRFLPPSNSESSQFSNTLSGWPLTHWREPTRRPDEARNSRLVQQQRTSSSPRNHSLRENCCSTLEFDHSMSFTLLTDFPALRSACASNAFWLLVS